MNLSKLSESKSESKSDSDATTEDCTRLYPSTLQFQNFWRTDLLDLVENGFAARFPKMKWSGLKRVAIVGAGPAGLVAAYELAKFATESQSELQVTIFDRDFRIGGRVKTIGEKMSQGHVMRTFL